MEGLQQPKVDTTKQQIFQRVMNSAQIILFFVLFTFSLHCLSKLQHITTNEKISQNEKTSTQIKSCLQVHYNVFLLIKSCCHYRVVLRMQNFDEAILFFYINN